MIFSIQQLMKEAGLANEESSAPNEASSISNEESSAPATQDTTQDTTQETEGGLFDTPAAETEALDDAVARKAISYVLGMKDTFLKKDDSAGRQYSMKKRAEAVYPDEVEAIKEMSQAASASRGQRQQFRDLSNVTDQEADDIFDATGVDVTGYKHVVDEDLFRKIEKLRANRFFEHDKGVRMPSPDELPLLPLIIHEYDSIDDVDIHESGTPAIQYTKKIGETFYVVEEIRKGRKNLLQGGFIKVSRRCPMFRPKPSPGARPKQPAATLLK